MSDVHNSFRKGTQIASHRLNCLVCRFDNIITAVHEEPKAVKERVVAQVPSKSKYLCDVFLAACIPHNNYTK